MAWKPAPMRLPRRSFLRLSVRECRHTVRKLYSRISPRIFFQDFLPSPSELAFREEGVKVTLALSKKSVEFFKLEAEKHQTQYQRMIRRLIHAYVDAQAVAAPTRHRARPQKNK
jgi:predicted DNA binding CopG/RHH family protein